MATTTTGQAMVSRVTKALAWAREAGTGEAEVAGMEDR